MTTRGDAASIEGHHERRKLVERAGVVGAGTLASRVLGLLRDMALAAVFERDATDAWWVAFTIPNALRQILGEGAVSSAVVPVLADKLANEGDAAAQTFFARIRGVSLAALVAVTVLGVAFAGPLTELFAAGYRSRPGELERTVALTRAVFPYIFFMGTAALGMAALNANRRFAVAAFAPGLLNVALLAAALGLPGVFAAAGFDPVLSLAVGALVGGLLQVLAQAPALRAIGYANGASFAIDDDVRKVLRRLAPLTFGIGVYYVDLVLSRRFLSELGPGAQSYFSWAMRLCDFPQGIFVMALSTAALPSLSTLAAKGAPDELAKTWAHGMNLAMFVAVPASALLAVVGEPIVVTLFQRGAFDAAAARETARALAWQGGAIWTVAVVRQTVPAYYALGDTRTPVIVSAIDLCAFIALAVFLRGPMGHVGDQRGGRRVERRADGAPAGGLEAQARHDLGPQPRPIDRSNVRGGGDRFRGRLGRRTARHAGRHRVCTRSGSSRGRRDLRVRRRVFRAGLGSTVARARRDRRGVRKARPKAEGSTMSRAIPETRVVDARFVAGAVTNETLPAPALAEVAFAGRSNVGKSSLLNALMQRRNLARTSNTPGCTRQLNLFEVRCADGLAVAFADLPGYGWAKRSKSERAEWQTMIEGYLKRRVSLRAVVVLVDVRRGPEDEERELAEFLRQPRDIKGASAVELVWVATKMDKIGGAAQKPALARVARAAGAAVVAFSATTGQGRDELWARIRGAVLNPNV
jgi:putative peptidoglycan lipid II flippase